MADIKNRWQKFQHGHNYDLVNLGRPARFLVPCGKLAFPYESTTVEKHLKAFLTQNFGAFTTSIVPNFGIWRNETGQLVDDECREFRVSFLGKRRIALLLEELALVAHAIGEACIYVEAGQYAALVYPKKQLRGGKDARTSR